MVKQKKRREPRTNEEIIKGAVRAVHRAQRGVVEGESVWRV